MSYGLQNSVLILSLRPILRYSVFLTEGNIVDDAWAQKLFPHAVNVDGFGQRAAESTKKAIASGATVLLQPTFMTSNISCRGDILVKNDDGTWDIYEVKSSTSVKEEHILDVAFQRICLEEARNSRTSYVPRPHQ